MKPVLILQHQSDDGPAFLATWLRANGLSFEVFNTQAGQDFPASMAPYGALAVLGGEMSANDALPSLRQAERLILEAMMQQRPVVGHCLGGQLMARALGARVQPTGTEEIGWHEIVPTPAGAAWFDGLAPRTVFQWHREGFELPAGAEHLAGNAACAHQAFAIGPHLAMQFHIEIDEGKLRDWVFQLERTPSPSPGPSVQGPQAIQALSRSLLSVQQRLAHRLYQRWLQGVVETDALR
jgi:GMP synthase (glutamine-hydrolysing)